MESGQKQGTSESRRQQWIDYQKRRRLQKDESFLSKQRESTKVYESKPENKVKIKARNKIRHLCRTGKVLRGPCEDCGDPKSHAHHEDYSKPLDVHWLCSKCHGKRHRK